MREIKFRAWVKEVFENGELVHGGYMIQPYEIKSIFVNKAGSLFNGPRGTGIEYFVQDSFLPGIGHHERISFDEIELMQYTGIKDKNGMEIYEGDIVTRGDGNFKVIYKQDRHYIGWVATDRNEASYIHIWYDGLEVIGNIYEHPHLLK